MKQINDFLEIRKTLTGSASIKLEAKKKAELERQLAALRAAMELRLKRLEKVKRCCRCPMNLEYIDYGDHFRCTGGSHACSTNVIDQMT